MKKLLILGAGTAGTMVANHMVKELPKGWSVSVVDPEPEHLYQPGLLFLPFGAKDEDKNIRPRKKTLNPKVNWIQDRVEVVDAEKQEVVLASNEKLDYDMLVIASGSRIDPEETPGLLGPHWGDSIHEFYTLEGALKLRQKLETWEGGRMAVNIVEMPIKCPVAPLEFMFLADAFFHQKGIRDRVEFTYVTPLDGAFTKPACSEVLSYMLEEKKIHLQAEFNAGEVDGDKKTLNSYDGREIEYDLLITIPTHKGAPFIEDSGLGDELGFVPTDQHTMRSKEHENIFVLGDASNVPTSKAGSVAHFQAEVVAENLMHTIKGEQLVDGSDGHANCFIESGFGKALLIDFNYYVEPLPGHYPLPGIGPFSLLKESRINHLGKLAFRPIYWNALLPARPLPVANRMSMVGKKSFKPTMAHQETS